MRLPFTVLGKGLSLHLVATEDIAVDCVVETCPLIFSSKQAESSLKKTHLARYFYPWNQNVSCFLLGYGGIINPTKTPNVVLEFDYAKKEVRVKAAKSIKTGELLQTSFSNLHPVEVRRKVKLKSMLGDENLAALDLPFEIGQSPILGIRSLLAAKDLDKGTIIESCPAVLFSTDDEEYIDHTILVKYYFDWSEDNNAVCFGYGSLMNHSDEPNVQFHLRKKTREIEFITLRQVRKGEDLMVSYRGYGDDQVEGELESHYFDFDEHLQI